MSIESELQANVRTSSAAGYSSGMNSVAMNRRGDVSVAQGLPPKTELARLGNTWTCQIATGSAFTNVANMPTTRAELAFYNGYTDGTCLIVDSIWGLSLTSVTAASGFTLIYQIATPAALTNDTAQLINSPLGKTYSGSVLRAVAVTTMTANKWAVVGNGPTGAAASIGAGAYADVNGGIIVRPGYTIGLNWVVGTATGTSLIGMCWTEAVLDIGS
jgi:hypothetical protein